MARVGRPRKLSKQKINKIISDFEEYIRISEIPIVSEFAYTHDVSRDDLYNYDEFYAVLKKCIAKKEAQLERKALNGEVSTPMAIFSLKQLGWSDKQEIEHSGEVQQSVIVLPANGRLMKEIPDGTVKPKAIEK